MLAHSIEIVVHPAARAAQNASAKTQRYRFGEIEKMERGVPLASGCNRVVLRTLREWLMSVPVQPADGDVPVCAHGYRLALPPATAAATAATGN